MNQQAKKPPIPSPAKLASDSTSRVSQTAYSAAETTRKSAQNVVNISTNAVRDIIASGTGEAQKAQEKVFEMSRESAENIARSADIATKVMVEALGISRENVEAAVECSSIAAGTAKEISSELAEAYNRCFSECVELSKEAFGCRTINDVADLQNKALRSMMDMWFTESSKICNMLSNAPARRLSPLIHACPMLRIAY